MPGRLKIWNASTSTWDYIGVGTPAAGVAFPSSPATNDQFFRTDLGLDFFYDGTRWLTSMLFSAVHDSPARSATATTVSAYMMPQNPWGTDMWLVDWVVNTHIAAGGTALGASHKWVGVLTKRDLSNVDGATPGTVSRASGASSTWVSYVTALNQLFGVASSTFVTRWTITGTPGNLTAIERVTYRLVGP